MADKITYPAQTTGSSISASEFNQIKPSVNALVDEVAAAQADADSAQTTADSAVSGLANKVDKSGTDRLITTAEGNKLAGVATGATANATDAQLRDRATHTGTQSADTITDGSTNKVFTSANQTKLSGIATGATANDTDANLKNRANHTGTQPASTITGLAAVATSGSKADVGLSNVNNTSDLDKPVSTAQASINNTKQDTLQTSGGIQVIGNRLLQARTGKYSGKSAVGIGSRSPYLAPAVLSNGTDTSETSRIAYRMIGNVTEFQVVFTNFEGVQSTQLASNDITVQASIEYPANTFTRITFNGGQNSALLKKGFYLDSDTIRGLTGTVKQIPDGAIYWIRTLVTVGAGEKWIKPITTSGPGGNGWLQVGDFVVTGTGTSGGPVNCYGPTLILGISDSRRGCILWSGDSLSAGQSDSGGGATSWGFNVAGGWYGRAFGNNFSGVITHYPSQTALQWDKSASALASFQDEIYSVCDYHICNLGTNDLGLNGASAATLKSLWIKYKWGAAFARGVKTWQLTITPRTSSTDGWTTLENQTIPNASLETARLDLNAWLRDGAPIDYLTNSAANTGATGATIIRAGNNLHPLGGIFDVAVLVESPSAPGKFKADGGAAITPDGLHFNSTGYAMGAPAIDVSVFNKY